MHSAFAYGADEDVAIIGASDVAGAIMASDDGVTISSDDDGAIGVSLDGVMTSDIMEETSDITEEASDITEETTGAADELTTGASLDETTALDGAVSTTVVVVPRLKIQIRPMITITATMMIIQVLRFMGLPLVGGDRPGVCLQCF